MTLLITSTRFSQLNITFWNDLFTCMKTNFYLSRTHKVVINIFITLPNSGGKTWHACGTYHVRDWPQACYSNACIAHRSSGLNHFLLTSTHSFIDSPINLIRTYFASTLDSHLSTASQNLQGLYPISISSTELTAHQPRSRYQYQVV